MISFRKNLPYRRNPYFGWWLGLLLVCSLVIEARIFVSILDKTIGPVANLWRRPGGPIVKVALLKSWNSAVLSEPNPEDYFEIERQWEIILGEAGIEFRVIRDEDLTAGVSAYANVLILPSVVCMSDGQRQAIRELAQRGMGFVASGAVGARNSDCSWKGWDTLSALSGLKDPATATLPFGSYAGIRGGQFFSETVPAGYRLSVPGQELIVGNARSPDVYWADGRLRPVRGDSADDVALGTHGIYGAGRVVWFGFKETLPDSSGNDQRVALNRYLTQAVRWTGRQPLATFGNWPAHSRAAMVVAESVEDIESAGGAADLFREAHIPATFFVDSAHAEASPVTMRKLQSAGEIAAAGDSGAAFTDQGADKQRMRLEAVRGALEHGGLARVVGFDPPQQVWNDATVAALEKSGYSYFFDHSLFDQAVPEFLRMAPAKRFPPSEPVELARIGVMAPNDMEVISRYRGPTPWQDDLADGFLRDFRLAEYLGGVYTLSFRSDLLGAPENLHILRALVDKIKFERPWMASGKQLTDWWSQRDKIRLGAHLLTPSRIRLSITNRDTHPLIDATIYVYLPRKPKTVRIQPALLNRIAPRSELMNGSDDVLRLDFPRLNPESAYDCVIVLDEK